MDKHQKYIKFKQRLQEKLRGLNLNQKEYEEKWIEGIRGWCKKNNY